MVLRKRSINLKAQLKWIIFVKLEDWNNGPYQNGVQ